MSRDSPGRSRDPELSAMDFRRGGHVPGKRQPKPRDTVPAILAPHEAVLTPGAADKVGRATIDRLNAESRKPMKRSNVEEGKRMPMASNGMNEGKSYDAPSKYSRGAGDIAENQPATANFSNARRMSMGCSGVDNGSGMERAMGAHAEKMHPVGRR